VMRRADAIVVLGCAVRSDGTMSRALEQRVTLAARAHRHGVAPCIIASGGRRWGPHMEAAVMRRELIERGVPDAAVVMELSSLTTRGNCHYSSALLRHLGGDTLFVASCAWHLARAKNNFIRYGVQVLLPPASWLATSPPSTTRRVSERVSAWMDSCMIPAVRS